MSTITFNAFINDLHYDPKKGTLKIQLIAANYVSLDKLATLGPHDENVQVTLESAQTKITDVEAPISLDEEAATSILREASKKLRESEEEGEIVTEFPTPEASGEGEK